MKWEKMIEKLQHMGKDRFILLLLAGVMLVIIAVPTGQKEEKGEQKPTVVEADAEPAETDMEMYRARLCRQVEDFLRHIDGVGNTKVYITMHSSAEIIVERDSPYSKRTEEETTTERTRIVGETENDSQVVLIEQEDGSQAPIVVKEIVPTVKGVVVAAQGGGNEVVKKEITSLLMALFGIEEHKIRVVKLST